MEIGEKRKRGRPPSRNATEDAPNWEVKDILNHKKVDGKMYYLLQWYDDDSPTWEPEENLDCSALIEAYQKRGKQVRFNFPPEQRKKWKIYNEWYENTIVKNSPGPVGFNRDLELAFIFAVQRILPEKEMVAVVMWEGCDALDMVPYLYVKERAPFHLIEFFERTFKIELLDGRVMRCKEPGDDRLVPVTKKWEEHRIKELLHDYRLPVDFSSDDEDEPEI